MDRLQYGRFRLKVCLCDKVNIALFHDMIHISEQARQDLSRFVGALSCRV